MEKKTGGGGREIQVVRRVLDGEWKEGRVPALWDGATAGRIARVLAERYAGSAACSMASAISDTRIQGMRIGTDMRQLEMT